MERVPRWKVSVMGTCYACNTVIFHCAWYHDVFVFYGGLVCWNENFKPKRFLYDVVDTSSFKAEARAFYANIILSLYGSSLDMILILHLKLF